MSDDMSKEAPLFLPNVFLRILSTLFFRNPQSPSRLASIKKLKILVYQVGNIGDLVVSTPVYRALRNEFPQAEITLLSSTGSKKYAGAEEIIKPLNYIDNIKTFYPEDFVSWKDYYSFYFDIRKSKYDLIVYLPSNLWKTFHICRDMVFFFLAGIKYGIGFQVFEGYRNYLKYNILPKNEVDRLFDLLEPLGIKNCNRWTEFFISNEDDVFIKKYLSQHKISDKRAKVAVMAGGKYPSRLWPEKYFIEMIDLINKNFLVDIILLGSDSEKGLLENIKNQTKKKPLDSSGSLTIHQSGALIKQCDLLITNDTGPMHISAAIGTPTVSIFSAVDIPFLWYPSGNNHKVFYNKVDCSPCFQQKCDNHICMEGISVESVYKGVEDQLIKLGVRKIVK